MLSTRQTAAAIRAQSHLHRPAGGDSRWHRISKVLALARGFVLLPLLLAAAPSLALLAMESAERAAVVEFTFSLSAEFEKSVELKREWTLVLIPRSEELETIRRPVLATKPATVALPMGSEWEVGGELAGFWVQRQLIAIARGTGARKVEVQLWPLGTIRGKLRRPQQKAKLPSEVVVRTMILPQILGRPKNPAGARTCPVAEDGSWSCELPAGKLDIAVSATGFMPHYVWAMVLPPHSVRDLPPFALLQGASVAAWVAIEGGKIDPESCIARLLPATSCETGAGQAVRNLAKAVDTHVGGDGFVQFTDLAPGHYALEVAQPGYATATVSLIEVVAQRETLLPEPVLLKPPLTLSLEIVPPQDLSGQQWRVHLYDLSKRATNGGRPMTTYEGPADDEGRLAVTDLSPGEYSLEINDSAGNRIYSSSRELGPWQLESSTSQRIEIPQVRIKGRLSVGEEPVAATLWFGGKSGASRVRLESDAEGHFAGILPRAGRWPVAVEANRPRLNATTTVEIHPNRSGEAMVDLDLPDTHLFGRVVDWQGNPLAGATVVAIAEGYLINPRVRTDEAGTFDLRAVAVGEVALAAFAERPACQAGPHRTSLAEGMEIGPIELRCQEMKPVRGVVVSEKGPVAGALITMKARFPQIGSGSTTTGQSGSFVLDIPAPISRATVTIRAGGFGIQSREVELSELPLRLTLVKGIGKVTIQIPLTEEEFENHRLRIALFAAGIEITPTATTLREYPGKGDQPARAEFSQLAPGDYAACLLPVSSLAYWNPGEEPLTCVSGRLEANGHLTLSPPRPAER